MAYNYYKLDVQARAFVVAREAWPSCLSDTSFCPDKAIHLPQKLICVFPAIGSQVASIIATYRFCLVLHRPDHLPYRIDFHDLLHKPCLILCRRIIDLVAQAVWAVIISASHTHLISILVHFLQEVFDCAIAKF